MSKLFLVIKCYKPICVTYDNGEKFKFLEAGNLPNREEVDQKEKILKEAKLTRYTGKIAKTTKNIDCCSAPTAVQSCERHF